MIWHFNIDLAYYDVLWSTVIATLNTLTTFFFVWFLWPRITVLGYPHNVILHLTLSTAVYVIESSKISRVTLLGLTLVVAISLQWDDITWWHSPWIHFSLHYFVCEHDSCWVSGNNGEDNDFHEPMLLNDSYIYIMGPMLYLHI